MPTARSDRDFGYEVAANPISRAGVFPYTAKSIGFPGWESDPGKIVMVYRPEAELSDPDTLASARLQPWIDDHTMIGDPADEAGLSPIEHVGARGTLGEQIFYDPEQRAMFANLRLWSPSHEDAIDAGKKELSMGFRCVYDFQSGEFEGQHYDAIQTNLRFNHLASVDQGRMGPGVAVLDHARFTFDANDLREIKPMKTTKRVKTAKMLGVAIDALPAYFGVSAMDAAAQTVWNKTMDAEEDDGEGDAPKGGMTIEEAAETIKELADPLGELNASLAAIAAPAASIGDPSDMPMEEPDDMDEMEAEMDAAGNAVIDPGTGKPKMKKKVAPAPAPAPAMADATPPNLAAADSAIKVMKAASRRIHTALDGKKVPATLAAFDAAIATGEGRIKAIRDRHARRPAARGLDAAIQRIAALEKKITPTTDAAPMTPKEMMAEFARRDALYAKVSPAIGAFDHSAMTESEVAVYACDKLDLKPAKGTELAALNGYLHNRTFETPRSASSFSMDGAIKSSSGAQDFIAGKPKAA